MHSLVKATHRLSLAVAREPSLPLPLHSRSLRPNHALHRWAPQPDRVSSRLPSHTEQCQEPACLPLICTHLTQPCSIPITQNSPPPSPAASQVTSIEAALKPSPPFPLHSRSLLPNHALYTGGPPSPTASPVTSTEAAAARAAATGASTPAATAGSSVLEAPVTGPSSPNPSR